MPYKASTLRPRNWQPPQRASSAQRVSSAQRGHGYAYRKLRLQVLKEEPYCTLRLSRCTGISETADYIIPWSKGGQTIRSNLRGACLSCNSARQNR